MPKKIKVLIVSPVYPFPEYKDGIRKILCNLIRFKPENIEISILTLCEDADKDFLYMEKIYPEVDFYKVIYKRKSHKYYALKWLLSSYPIGCLKYKEFWSNLAESINKNATHYDIIHIETPFLSPLYFLIKPQFRNKLMLFPHDSLSMFFKRRFELQTSPFKKLLYQIEFYKARKLEFNLYPKYKKVIFVSDRDAKFVKKLNKNISSSYIPNGVDIKYFSPQSKKLIERDSLVFTGNMAYEPNKQAALFLIEKVVPILVRQKPNIRLYIVGINSDYLKSYENRNIVITGFVEDIRKYLAKAALYVSPLPFGSGIKNKILEAMSMAKVVLGTPVSFEGIDGIKNGVNAVIINSMNPKDWNDKILEFLKIDGESIGNRARKLIEENFSWEKIVEKYGELYENSISNG